MSGYSQKVFVNNWRKRADLRRYLRVELTASSPPGLPVRTLPPCAFPRTASCARSSPVCSGRCSVIQASTIRSSAHWPQRETVLPEPNCCHHSGQILVAALTANSMNWKKPASSHPALPSLGWLHLRESLPDACALDTEGLRAGSHQLRRRQLELCPAPRPCDSLWRPG